MKVIFNITIIILNLYNKAILTSKNEENCMKKYTNFLIVHYLSYILFHVTPYIIKNYVAFVMKNV